MKLGDPCSVPVEIPVRNEAGEWTLNEDGTAKWVHGYDHGIITYAEPFVAGKHQFVEVTNPNGHVYGLIFKH